MTSNNPTQSKIFYGWYVIGGLFVVAGFGPMGRYILTALFPFIMEDPGWSRQAIGLAFTIHFWVYALLAILAGRMVDQVGGRTTILIGGALMLIGLVFLSMTRELWQFYGVFGIVMAAAVSMSHFVPNMSLVRKWFIRKAGIATGVVTIGSVAGFAVLPATIGRLSTAYGWRTATFICGLGFGVVIMLTALLVIRNTPESMGLQPDGDKAPSDQESSSVGSASGVVPDTARETLKTWNFWWFLVAYSVIGIPLQGTLAHIIIWAVEVGYSPANSGLIMAAMTLPSVPVRVIGGWMGDRYGKQRVLVFFNLFAAAIWLAGWFVIKGQASFLAFVIVLGFAYSAPFSLYTPFLGDLFSRAIVGTLMGFLTLGHGIIGGVGPYLWGRIADATGGYLLNCPISAACYLVVALALFLLKVPGEEA